MRNIIYILILIVLSSCKRDPSYIFEVNDVDVSASTGEKNRLKTDIEFVSIAHTDIFGSNISSNDLDNITPIDKSSKTSIESFVIDTYMKLYNREPDAFEKWYLSDLIHNNDVINAEIVYFSMMTANEYRYY